MSTEIRVACLVAVLTATCGGSNTDVRTVEQPTLERVQPASESALGGSPKPGFLRACQTRAASAGLVELACDEHQLVEFRKVEIEGVTGSDQRLDQLMEILSARFGALDEERADTRIDDAPVRISHFQGADRAVHGVALTVDNVEGHFWGLACYRKDGEVDAAFCSDALATAARSGGLAHVEARAMQDFADGKLRVDDGCESTPGRGIGCSTGKLSWSASDVEAEALREETIENLQTMARSEEVAFASNERPCTLLGVSAQCQWIQLTNAKKGEELNFILATGGKQDRLVVCTFPGPLLNKGPLPPPCAQAIVILEP